MVAAYREPDNMKGQVRMRSVIDAIANGVPGALVEVRRIGRTPKQLAVDVLAFFDRPGSSNGPRRRTTDALNTSAAPRSALAT